MLSGHALWGLVWLSWMAINRWLLAGSILRVLGDPDWVRGTMIYPVRDLLGSILWLGSYASNRFYYRGKIYRLKNGGKVEAPDSSGNLH